MRKQVSLTWEEFVEQYKPINNHFTKDPDQQMFETYGEEDDFVRSKPITNIWTYVDVDMGTGTYNGYHWVNRIGYFITEVPWDQDTDYEVDLRPNLCDRCEEPFTQDFEHEDGLCQECCEGCEMDEFND